MQLVIQTDMFNDIPVGYRYWAIRSDNPADGNWVCVTQGTVLTDFDVKDQLGFAPSFIEELSKEQAMNLYPKTPNLQFNEYAKYKRRKHAK